MCKGEENRRRKGDIPVESSLYRDLERILSSQQQETNRLKLEILRHETEQSLKKLKQTLRPTSITPITRANVDAYAEIQHQVEY